jgi:hypothetical protein
VPKKTALPVAIMEGQRQPPPLEHIDEEGFGDQNWDHLQPRYIARRQLFVHEYLKDFNGSQAIQRMGYVMTQPWVKASQFLTEPYTQWYLGQLMAKLEDSAIITRSEILLGLKKEAHYHGLDGSAAARIAAWRTLGKILGLEVTKIEGNVAIQGGVMLMPFSGTPEEWEQAAQSAQEKLKQDVRK